jgi:hypothetical protein
MSLISVAKSFQFSYVCVCIWTLSITNINFCMSVRNKGASVGNQGDQETLSC